MFGNIGHWTCYKVTGTGINDFTNVATYDNDSAALNSGSISGSPTGTMQLNADVIYNGHSVSRPMEWVSSNTEIATISGTSGSAMVSFISNGSCTITASVENNPASDTCWVTVSASPTINNVILISPNTNYVLEGDEREYSVYLYENNVPSSGSFIITCNGHTVPSTSYTFTQTDGNHFIVDVYLRGAWQFDTI